MVYFYQSDFTTHTLELEKVTVVYMFWFMAKDNVSRN